MGQRADLYWQVGDHVVRTARAFVTANLVSWGTDELAQTAALCTSELTTNAIVHAGTGFHLTMFLEPPELLIEVHDGSHAAPRVQPASLDAASGRGLRLVEAMTDEWGYRSTSTGKVVWFILRETYPAHPDATVSGTARPRP